MTCRVSLKEIDTKMLVWEPTQIFKIVIKAGGLCYILVLFILHLLQYFTVEIM